MILPLRVRLLIRKHGLGIDYLDTIGYQLYDRSSGSLLVSSHDVQNILSYLEDLNSIPF